MDRLTSFEWVRRRFPGHLSLAYDRRGYAGSLGLTARPGSQSPFSNHVSDLVDIIDSEPVLLGRAIVLIGHSYGTNVAIGAACERVDRVVGLVGYEPPMPWADWWPGAAGGSTLSVGESEGSAAAAEAFMRRIVGDQIWERLPSKTKEARRLEGDALLADLGSLRGRPSPIDHALCRCPAVIGFGSNSLTHQQEASRRTAELLPDAELVELFDSTHGAHSSNPDGFSDLIRRVLATS
jgi:pimeloyl-ACP methyl ester carboxylesterase